MVAVSLWFLMVSRDVQNTIDLGRMLASVPRGPTRLVLDSHDEDDPKYIVKAMSLERKLPLGAS